MTKKVENVFEFSLGGKEYKVEKLKGRAARKHMFKIIGLFSRLVKEAQGNGFSLDQLFSRFETDGEIELTLFFDEIVNVIIAIGPVMSDEAFLDEFESLLPIILGVPDSVLEDEGSFLEVYSAAVRAMMFHVGQNMTKEASDSLRNFTTPSGPSEPEVPEEKTVLVEE